MRQTTGFRGVEHATANWLLSLYPAAWRRRYEDEFRYVLSACPPTIALIVDVCWGALLAHVTYGRVLHRTAARRRARARRASIAAFLLLALALTVGVSSGPTQYRCLGRVLT